MVLPLTEQAKNCCGWIQLSTNHEGLSQPAMKIGGGSTTVLASCPDL